MSRLFLLLTFAVSFPAAARAQPPDCNLPGVDDKCEAWVATYDGPERGLDSPRNLGYATQTIAVDPAGSRIYVTGASWGGSPGEGGTHYDYATIAYDAATGAQVWIAHYNGPGNSQDSGWAVRASPDGGRVYVTGMSHMGAPNWDFATVAYDAATGTPVWVSRYDASSLDRAWSLAVSPDGSRVFVTGDSGGDYGTVAYDAATGVEEWAASYDGPGAAGEIARFVDVSPGGGRVFVTGSSDGGPLAQTDVATVAYDAATGGEEWVARYNGLENGDDWGYALGVSPDASRVFVTGHHDGSVVTGLDYVTVAYDAATGGEEWVALYDGPGQSLDIPLSLAVSRAGGRVYVTGYSTGLGTSYDYGTVAYDAGTGAEVWVARYNGPAQNNSDTGYAVGVSTDDEVVFVTGESPPLSPADPYDIATLAYDAATGAQQWVARYNGPESFQDGAFALAVNPNGSAVYVNGESWHSTTPGVGDYATLAYALETTSVSLLGSPAAALALHGPRPNPATGDLVVSFMLSSGAGPATIELFDAAGRLLRSQEVRSGARGAAEHRVRLREGARLPSGVYWVRLTQGRQSVATKAVVAR